MKLNWLMANMLKYLYHICVVSLNVVKDSDLQRIYKNIWKTINRHRKLKTHKELKNFLNNFDTQSLSSSSLSFSI